MNEQLQKSMAEILALLTESAKTVGATAQQEVPLLVQEFLLWGVFDAVLWMLLCVALGVGVLRLGRRIAAVKSDGGWDENKGERLFFSRYVCPIGGYLLIVLGIIANLYQVLQVVFAPRVYLLRTVIEVIK